MLRRLAVILPAALVATGLLVLDALAEDGPPACVDGVLATDPVGDTYFITTLGDPIDDPALDLVQISTTVTEATVSFTTEVDDLGEGDPEGTTGILVELTIGTPSGSIVAEAGRSTTLGTETASIGAVTEGVSVDFDVDADTIRLTGPRAALGADVTSFWLTEAQMWAQEGVILAGTDDAGSACVVSLGEDEEAPTDPGNGGGHGLEKNGDKGKGRTDTDTDPEPELGFDPAAATVTIVDTGIQAEHMEFDYDPEVPGPNGQLVGWWDFSGVNASGAEPDAWYEGRAPYDRNGHGTGTSAMAVGRNVFPGKTPSACPGCALAVAKVHNENTDQLDGSVADAIRWGVDVVGSDVISISIGAAVPIPELLLDVHEAAGYARGQGALVVFANGNGWGNAGIPGQPGGILPYGNSTNVLSVGASDVDGFTATTDPEVAAQYRVSTADNDGAYHEISGTSFSAPFVAGGAARMVAEATECGKTLLPDDLERLIKVTARDTDVPPAFEGYGVVDLDTVDVALATNVLCGDADPPTPDAATEFYVENVSGTQRSVWTDTLDPGLGLSGETPVTTTPIEGATPAGVLGPSGPAGLSDTEVYEVVLAPGETLSATFDYGPTDLSGAGVQDFDVALYATGTDTYDGSTFVKRSGNTGDVAEAIGHTNTGSAPQTLRVVVYGWSIVIDQPLVITGLDSATLVYDGYTVGDHVVGSFLFG